MTKKKIMMAAMSAGLVAVVGVGGTLAYLSAQSNTVTNTVTVGTGYPTDSDGHQGLYLDETEYYYDSDIKENLEVRGRRTETGNRYENLFPGDSFIKDPTVHMIGGSVQSYVFVKVEGVDELENIKDGDTQVFDIADWNTNAWAKLTENGEIDENVAEGDGYYVYRGTKSVDNIVDVSLLDEGAPITLPEAVFETLSVNSAVKTLPENTVVADDAVTVTACAVQATATPQGVANAFAQAKGSLDNIGE